MPPSTSRVSTASKPSVGTGDQPRKKPQQPQSYSFITRCLHWIVARIALIQTILLFLWLAERARREAEPPLRPWIIYMHAFVGLVGSTGLSARLLPRASLYALTALQLHTGYVYAFQPRLIYSRWLRTRLTLRSLAAGGVYLRMLGTANLPFSAQLAATGPSFQSGLYMLGLTLLCAFSAVSGLVQLPLAIVSIDREAQSLEQGSMWQLVWLSRYNLQPWISGLVAILFLMASLLYSVPLLLSGTTITSSVKSSTVSAPEFASRLADRLTLAALAAITLLCDTHVDYWVAVGSEFWLHMRLLVDNFIIFAGILITCDLATESKRCTLKSTKKD